jgi:hypothetical protein
MTKQEAIAKAATGWWKTATAQEIVALQLYEERACMPFDEFHEAIEKALGRPVYTHEFGLNVSGLKAEFEKKRGPATLAEIVGQLTELGKPVILVQEE